MTIEYRNLITGVPAQQQRFKKDYFELEVQVQTYGYLYATSEGEFLGAFGSHDSFGQAWIEALTYTPIGGTAYQAYQSEKIYKAEDSEGFDPYAGNLDLMLGY